MFDNYWQKVNFLTENNVTTNCMTQSEINQMYYKMTETSSLKDLKEE